ncbi:uncharacterized protein LOC103521301 [Nephila pilipes]|uniref:Uncharacterized protein LOC103521301 n=1 Tax=Nephila pilipes TaxID=299642 RepID=A0A8X6JZZ0_NEPPI|nr:uncharacterized protein LOC103521301 [Nephila pilipes]
MPRVTDHIILNSNEDISKKRLKTTIKKLFEKKQLDYYTAVLNQWIKDGVIEDVPFNEIEKKSHYLPLTSVFKESYTMKVRPMFDASCKYKNSLSLSDCLEKGPNLLDEIYSHLTEIPKRKK